jgi:hypothetical protein
LSKEVDIRIQDEENLKKYKSIEFTLLNKEIAERLEEINTIKDELNIFKTKE